jgi:acetyl esterase/lipase
VRTLTDTYKTVDGLPIQVDLHRPDDDRVHPVVVWIHGGALIMGSRSGIMPAQLDAYVTAGYAVAAIDYRLAPETKLASIVDDVVDAIAWLREIGASRFGLDPERLAAVGHSAGGYLALTAGARCRARPTAVVAFYGYADVIGPWYSQPDPFYRQRPLVSDHDAFAAVGTSPLAGATGLDSERRFLFYLYCRQQGLWPRLVSRVDLRENPRGLDAWCPIQQATADYPPTMLLHGDRDTDVPYRQSVDMAAALTRLGVPCELVTIPGGEHGFDRAMSNGDAKAADAFDKALGFLNRHLADG